MPGEDGLLTLYKQLWWEDGVMHVHGKVMKVLCEKPEYILV